MCMYVCTCVCMCYTCVLTQAPLCVWERRPDPANECLLLFISTLFCERGFPQSVGLALLARLAGQALKTCLSPTSLRAWAVDAHGCTWVLGIWTQVVILKQWALYKLSCLPSPLFIRRCRRDTLHKISFPWYISVISCVCYGLVDCPGRLRQLNINLDIPGKRKP